jgi:hypothetical protein
VPHRSTLLAVVLAGCLIGPCADRSQLPASAAARTAAPACANAERPAQEATVAQLTPAIRCRVDQRPGAARPR